MVSPEALIWLKPDIQLQPIINLGKETSATLVRGNSIVKFFPFLNPALEIHSTD
jgi:hypothetical protein